MDHIIPVEAVEDAAKLKDEVGDIACDLAAEWLKVALNRTDQAETARWIDAWIVLRRSDRIEVMEDERRRQASIAF